MNVLNIHGYNGNPQNSAYTALNDLECNIISPSFDYDNEAPDQVMGRLRYLAVDQRIEMIIGTSLGGFYAAALSYERNLPVILVNPFLMPFLTFPEYINPFISLFGTFSKLDRSNVSCIIGAEDELLGDHQFTKDLLYNSRFRSVPGGKHSGATLPLTEYFREMLHYYEDILPKKEIAECVPTNIFEDD